VPMLALMILGLLLHSAIRQGLKKTLTHIAGLFLSVAVVYIFMFIDKALALWQGLGLDYSTHTALALVLAVFLIHMQTRLVVFSLISTLLYWGLMVFQNYHTVLDILSTFVVVLPVCLFILFQSKKYNSVLTPVRE